MENKNSCKENFEMAKTELQDMEAIADFFLKSDDKKRNGDAG